MATKISPPEGFTISRGGDDNQLAVHHDDCEGFINWVPEEGMTWLTRVMCDRHECEETA